jgi:hypothetical protein
MEVEYRFIDALLFGGVFVSTTPNGTCADRRLSIGDLPSLKGAETSERLRFRNPKAPGPFILGPS